MGDSGIAGLWLRLALVLIVAMLVGVGSVLLANRTLPKPVAEGHNSTLSPFLTCVALVYGPLLGFTVVVAWGHFSSAEANVAHEASTLTTMYRQTVGMPVPEQTQMRELLRKYAKTVEGPEGNKQDVGSTSDTAQAALTEMYKVLAREQSSVASNATSCGVSRPADRTGVRQESANAGRATPKTRVAVGRSPLRRCRTGGAQRFHAPGEHTWSPNALKRDRPSTRPAAVHRLLARPSLREPAGHYLRTVSAITGGFRRNRPRHIEGLTWSLWCAIASAPAPRERAVYPRRSP